MNAVGDVPRLPSISMSSSRRQSTSSTTRRSTLAVSRKPAPTPSVSIVFAEPEQSSPPLGSAAAKLSPRVSLQNIQNRRKEAEPGQIDNMKQRAGSVYEGQLSSSKRTRTESLNSLPPRMSSKPSIEVLPSSKSWFPFRRTPSKQSLTVPEATQASNIPGHCPTAESRDSIDISDEANTHPGSDPPLFESPKNILLGLDSSAAHEATETHLPSSAPISIKSTSANPQTGASPSPSQRWFGSFSKSQKRVLQTELKQDEGERTTDLSPVSEDRSRETSPTSQQPPPSSHQSIWFTQSPPRPQLEHLPSVPSSLDIKSPVQQNSPPIENPMPEMELVSSHSPEARLSTLNPSTSRFTLSMPLLGRPKVPLKKALVRTNSEQTAMPSSSASIAEATPQIDAPAPLDLVLESAAPIEGTDPEEMEKRPSSSASSWWHYIGLSGDENSAPTPAPVSSPPPEMPVITISTVNSEALPSEIALPNQNDSEKATEETGQSPPVASGESNTPENGTERPRSVTSAQTTASAWFSPWGIYEWYSASATPETPEVSEAPKTEAELVKEEALARPDPTEATPVYPMPDANDVGAHDAPTSPSSPSAEDKSSEFTNPLIASLAGNTKGWASFFASSRSLTTKLVTENGEKSDGEMEVMNIDEDEGNGSSGSPPVSAVQHGTYPDRPNGSDMQREPLSKEAHDLSSRPIRAASLKDSNKVLEISKDTPGVPLTSSDSIKRKVACAPLDKRSASPTPSTKSAKSVPSITPRPPNLVLPTFNDTFCTLPRSLPPPAPPPSASGSTLKKTLGFVSNVLFAREQAHTESPKGKGRAHLSELGTFGKELPRCWEALGEDAESHVLSSCNKVVVIGVHGWFPGYAMRTVIGEPTGTSTKFANMMGLAVEEFAEKHGVKIGQITKIPLEGEGKIEHRVEKLYHNLISDHGWVEALHEADVIFVATHSQGSIVSTHLISRLITDGHIQTMRSKSAVAVNAAANIASGSGGISDIVSQGTRLQRVCCLALCGIHLGPLAYLQKNSFLMPYLQYFESEAAAELFEFHNTESQVSKEYVQAVRHNLEHEVKMVYIASLNDQVVPVYSGAFTSASHPLILRALYIDGDAYHSSDFLSNLLVLLLRIRNAGLSDGGLLAHLSEATAGSLNGVGHSTAYEDLATFSLAVEYLFLVNDGFDGPHELHVEPFNARDALNDYEIPWALRDLIADERVVHLFSKEFSDLRDAFDDWHPRTTILRDLKRKLEPIRRLKFASRL